MIWAKSVVSSFGGNPNLITIVGESAGAGSVSAHLVSTRSSGLFQRAIMESTGFGPWAAQPYSIAKTRFGEVVSNCGCTSAPDVVSCMRALNWSTLLGCDKDNVIQGVVEWSPVVDGVELIDTPFNMVAQGKLASDVPVLFGFNRDEGTLFNHEPYTLNASNYESAIAGYLSAPLAAKVAAQYPVSQFSTPWWGISQILRDSVMGCPATSAAQSITTIPGRNAANGVYAYFYVKELWVIQYIVDAFKPLGVFHGSELVMTFDFDYILWGGGEKQMAQTMVKYWTNFAATGNPNQGLSSVTNNVPKWPAWGSNSTYPGSMVQIDGSSSGANVTVISGTNWEGPNCAFWAANPVPLSSIFG
jgi:carboxylesterase type B